MSNENFFNKKHCDRCNVSLESKGRIMSMYNEDCLCTDCKEKETKRPDYKKANEADYNEIKKGNYNFSGIGYKEDKV